MKTCIHMEELKSMRKCSFELQTLGVLLLAYVGLPNSSSKHNAIMMKNERISYVEDIK